MPYELHELLPGIIMGVFLVCSAFISASETALFSLTAGEVSRIQQGPKQHLIPLLLGNSRRLLLTILLLNNAINVGYFAIASWWAAQAHINQEMSIAIPIAALITLIALGEIVPKVVASSHPERYARVFAPPLYLSTIFMAPVCGIIERFCGDDITENTGIAASETISNEELKLVIDESRKHGVVSQLTHDRLLEIIDLTKTTVDRVMTHRVECVIVPVDANTDEVMERFSANPSPYIIVVDKQEDCVGVLTAQDLFRGERVSKRMRKPLYIPEALLLPQAIHLFQNHADIFGVVVDEYGGTAGLLSLAHIGNAVLGAGESEDIPSIDPPEQLNAHEWRIDGQMPLDGWETLINEEDMQDCTTIAGFVTKALGSVPDIGDSILYRNLQFQVIEVENKRINAVILKQLSAHEARRLSTQTTGDRI